MKKRILSFILTLALCLGLLPATAWAAGSAYTESTDDATNTITYTFTTFHNVNAGNNEGAQTFRVDAGKNVVLDFTQVPQSEVTEATFTLDLVADIDITVKGDPAVDYTKANITVNNYPGADSTAEHHYLGTLYLEDFQTSGGIDIDLDEEHPATIQFDGNCQAGRISAKYLTLEAADDAASLSLKNSLWNGDSLTMDGGTYQMGYRYISYPQVTILDANIVFSKTSGYSNEYQYIEAQKLTIEDSTIQGIASIYSVETYGSVDETYQETFAGSAITIRNSVITYGDEVNSSYDTGMLCNSRNITIEDSTITGAAAVWNTACIGGIFETLTIRDSEVYIESEYTGSGNWTAPAIGPDRDAYVNYMGKLNITAPSITIADSVVQAVSRHSAAIGLPYLHSSDSTTNLPQLSITIKGSSNITATSVYSPAIGGSSKADKIQDDGLVAAEIVADNPGIISWEPVDGGESPGELSLAAAPASSSLNTFAADSAPDVSLMAASADDIQQDIVEARNLLGNCTIAIEKTDSGTPTISAKSGVLAIYGSQVKGTDTDLVQATMVRTTGSTWSVYPMETPGNVTIGSGDTAEIIGQLGYGYASVASTGIGAQTDAAMAFGDSSLKDVVNDSFEFTTSGSGFEEFFVTPQDLSLSGTVTLKKGSDTVTTAAVGETLTADLTDLSPIRAKDRISGIYNHLSFQWYRDGVAISRATDTTYTLTNSDNGKIITCVVSVKSGDAMFTGSVTSSAVLVGTTSLDAPTLEDRTVDSITLDTVSGCQYGILTGSGITWKNEPTFTGLTQGTAYTFILKDSSDNLSTAATFYTLSDTPDSGDFTIDYVAEQLTFPAGVNLYSDEDCITCLNAYSPRTWISISSYTGTTLYARYRTVDPSDTESVTEIEIPARPGVNQVSATVTGNSISFTGESGVEYRLTLDDAQVGEVKTGSGSEITFDQLQPGTEYVLMMRKEATADSFRSAQVNQTVRTKGSYDKNSTLLADVKDTTRSYDLTSLLGGLEITNVQNTTGSFVTSAAQDTTNSNSITLTFSSPTAGDKGTVTVTAKDADSTLTLNLTLEAVETMAVNADSSVFWVRETAHPGYVGMTDSSLKSAWTTGLRTAGLTNHTHENSFALVPRYVVGGGTATNETDQPEITWTVTGAADAASTEFTVLSIDSSKNAQKITNVTNNSGTLTFNAQSKTALYLVAWKERQDVKITVSLRNDTTTQTPCSEFQHGQSLTASVYVRKTDSTSSLPLPSGTVTLYLGGSVSDGVQLGTATTLNSAGNADIKYTLGDDTPYSNAPQTLYIVYSGDTNYNGATKEETVTFKATAPDKPVLSAEAGLDSVKLTWTTPATHGSAITGYELAVKQNGTDIQGSPFQIEDADATAYTVSNLESGKEYTFTLTVQSAAGNAASQAVSVTTLSQSSVTILLPSGAAGSRSYNLYQWLGLGSSATITVQGDSNNIVNTGSTTYSGSYLTLNYNAATAGQTATLKIENGSNLLTVTVEVVDVVKEYTSGIFVVKGNADPSLVGMIQEELTAAWDAKLNALGMENAQTDAFSLVPRSIVGGQTVSTFATVTWKPDAAIELTDYRFVVLALGSNKNVQEITPKISDDAITFSTTTSAFLYLVAWQKLETPDIDVSFSGATDNTFEFGSTVTATVTVSGTSGTPAGTVTVYLGDPDNGGSQIGQKYLSNGAATIELPTSGMTAGEQALTFVYGANGNYKSASTAKEITLVPAGTSQSETILLPVGSSVTREYDLSTLLDGAEIKSVAVGTDSDNIFGSVAHEGNTLKLTGNAVTEGKTATVTVTAEKADGSTLTLNLTVKAVTVLAEQEGVFFVQEYPNPSMVNMDAQELLAAWEAVKDTEGFQNAAQHSFAILPRTIIGNDTPTNAGTATIIWTPSGSQVSVAEGSFLVLHIGKGDSSAESIAYQRTGDSLTFTADGEDALYCVVYKQATGGAVTVSAELQKNGTATSSFRYGDTLTAMVTIEPTTTTTGLKPGGTVNLYLGDPDDGGKLLASGQMSDGSGTITYVLNDSSILSNAEQTLYIVYSGDNNYLGGQTTAKAYLQPAPSGGTVTPQPEEDYSSCDGGTDCPLWEFTDLDVHAWYHDGVHYCLEEGLMEGYGEGIFGPNNDLSRAMLVQIFYNYENRPTVSSGSVFDDVADGAWYADAVTWAASQSIVGGYGNGNYGPNDPITREQLAAILYRYAQYKGYDVSVGEDTNILSYTDAFEISEYAVPAFQWACGAGVIEGVTESTLVPRGNATRAQVATMLMRFCVNVAKD